MRKNKENPRLVKTLNKGKIGDKSNEGFPNRYKNQLQSYDNTIYMTFYQAMRSYAVVNW